MGKEHSSSFSFLVVRGLSQGKLVSMKKLLSFLSVPTQEVMVVADPEAVRDVTVRKFKSFRDRPLLETLAAEHTKGIFFAR